MGSHSADFSHRFEMSEHYNGCFYKFFVLSVFFLDTCRNFKHLMETLDLMSN